VSGAGALLRLALRRDRRALPLWVLGLGALVVLAGAGLQGSYPTQADRNAFAASVTGNGALIALRGPQRALETAGGALAWQLGWFAAVLAGLMGALLVVRHTRGDEESGRTELLLAAPVARTAPAVAALAVAGIAAVLAAAVITLGLLATGLPAAGSVAFGASVGGVALVFAGVALVTAQVSESARAASGLAGAAIGAAYVLRAIGDVGDGTVSWLSPIGWAQAMRPYAGERWWPLLLFAAATAALVALALALLARRDHGAGLVRPGPGAPVASGALRSPLGLALRLQRGTLLGWGAGLLALGAAYGSFARDVGDLLDTSAQVEDFFSRAGGASIIDSYLATVISILALLGTGFTIQSVLRLRGEETAGRAEPVLAAPLARARWALSHAAVALAGTTVLLALGGAAMGLADAVRGGGLEQVPRLAGAALAQAPAAWVLGALALLCFGLWPRRAALAWVPLGWCVVAGLLGPLFGLPDALADASPFALAPSAPADSVTVAPLLALTAAAAAAGALGLAAFRRRDLTP